MTGERMAKAKHLKAAITAGIGSDHVDLQAAAIQNKVDVCEVQRRRGLQGVKRVSTLQGFRRGSPECPKG
eukprot:919498-Prorocentrum_minimum.AAC.1